MMIKMKPTFPEWLRKRLQNPLPGWDAQAKMRPESDEKRYPIPPNPKKSSVLILIYPENQDYHLLLIERSKGGGVHSGQMAFPGGKEEKEDKSPADTALREACEEVHLHRETVELLGRLTSLYIPVSDFEVRPFVAFSEITPQVSPSPAEVAQIVPFSFRRHFPNKAIEQIPLGLIPGLVITSPSYRINEKYFVWGATAMILSELEALWQDFLAQRA